VIPHDAIFGDSTGKKWYNFPLGGNTSLGEMESRAMDITTHRRRGKINPILIVVLLLVLVAGAGAGYYFTRDDATKKQLNKDAERVAIKTEVQATKAKIETYKKFLAKIDEIKKSGAPAKPKYEGYDAFDYNKETEYKSSLDEQQRRLGDLNARLGSAYDK
jgi:hypothetical protein